MTRQKVDGVGVDLRSLGKVRKMGVKEYLLHGALSTLRIGVMRRG